MVSLRWQQQRSTGAPCFGKGQGKIASNAAEARSNYIVCLGPNWRGSFNRYYPFCLLFPYDTADAWAAPAGHSFLATRHGIAGRNICLPAYSSPSKTPGVAYCAAKYVPQSLSFPNSIHCNGSQADPNTNPIDTQCDEVDSTYNV